MEVIYPPWIEEEFKSIDFNDLRLTKRFKFILTSFMKNAQSNIASVFENWASIKGCYRFFDNAKTDVKLILSEHIDKTISRIDNEKGAVLILHDTTYFDYKNRHKTLDLDRITKGKLGGNGISGLLLHNSFAISNSGIPLGLVNQTFIRRKTINPNSVKLKKHLVHKIPVEKKESYRWIKSIRYFQERGCQNKDIIHITDREGDFYELYRECAEINSQFIIRASHNRSINKKKRRELPTDKLFDYFESQPVRGKVIIDIQVNQDKKYRKADLSLSFGQYTLPPPPDRTVKKDGNGLHNVNLWGVLVKEDNPPVGVEPLKWMLTTNLPIDNIEKAIQIMNWYKRRWNIELFHKILKSGCTVESAQLRSRDKLIKYITVSSIIAWRIFWLSRHILVANHFLV